MNFFTLPPSLNLERVFWFLSAVLMISTILPKIRDRVYAVMVFRKGASVVGLSFGSKEKKQSNPFPLWCPLWVERKRKLDRHTSRDRKNASFWEAIAPLLLQKKAVGETTALIVYDSNRKYGTVKMQIRPYQGAWEIAP